MHFISTKITLLIFLFICQFPFSVTYAFEKEANEVIDAKTQNILQLLEILKDNKTISKEQFETLKTQFVKSANLSIEDDYNDDDYDDGYSEDDESNLAIKTEGGLEVSTFDGQYSFELSGRILYDYTLFSEDKNVLGNDSSLRKAYLGVEGKIDYDWGYELTIDFAGGEADIKDAYISYLGQTGWLWKFGHVKEPFSLSELTSSKYSTFLERPMLTEFSPGRSLGVNTITYGSHWTLAASLTSETWDNDPDDEGSEGWGSTIRSTYAPWHTDTQALHFGVALSYRETDDEQKVKFDTRPETKNTGIKFLNTGKIKQVDNITRMGLETAWVEGPFSAQAEYVFAELERQIEENLSFSGWYVTASWMVTGESRDYKFKKGSFGRMKPYSPFGAWEVALRYSALDLNDKDITGGSGNISTIGINWYVNERIRTMLNYAIVDNDEFADDDGDVLPSDNPNYVQLRLQIDF